MEFLLISGLLPLPEAIIAPTTATPTITARNSEIQKPAIVPSIEMKNFFNMLVQYCHYKL